MVLPGGKVIATKTLAIAGSALVAVAGITVGVMLVLNGEKSYRNISVVDAIGGVAIFRRDVNDTFDAYKGMNLFAGDDVNVGPSSELDLQLDEDKWVYIEENTHMWLEADGDADNSKTIIYLNEGAVLNKIDNKLSNESVYKVETPNTTMSIRGTVVRVAVFTDDEGIIHTDYAVPEGTVEIQLHTVDGELVGEPIMVPQGYQIKTRGDEDFSEVILQPVADKDEDQEIAPINLKELPASTHQILADIVMAGRPLYVGEREVLNDETHVFLLDPDEEPLPEEVIEEEAEEEIEEGEVIIPTPTPTPTPTPVPILERIIEHLTLDVEPTEAPVAEALDENTDDSEESDSVEPTPIVLPTPTVTTHTVTFMYNGSVFGTQTVEDGKTASKPLLSPNGSNDNNWININQPVYEDVVLNWEDIGS